MRAPCRSRAQSRPMRPVELGPRATGASPGRDRCSRCSACRRAPASFSLAELQAMVHPDDEPLAAIAARAQDGERVVGRLRVSHAQCATANGSGCASAPTGRRRDDRRAAALVGIARRRHRPASARPKLSATADQRLREAIEAISEAFVLWDSGNRLVLCNSKYQRLHNLPRGGGARRRALCRTGRARRAAARRPRDRRRSGGETLGARRRRAPTRRASPTAAGCRSTSGARATAASSRSAPTSPRSRSTRATAQIRAPAARHGRPAAPVAPLAGGAGAAARRSRRALSRAEGAGGDGQPRQGRIPRQHEPRAAHAAQRDHRLLAIDGRRDFRPAGLGEISRLLRPYPRQRPISAQRLQRRARHVAARSRAAFSLRPESFKVERAISKAVLDVAATARDKRVRDRGRGRRRRHDPRRPRRRRAHPDRRCCATR